MIFRISSVRQAIFALVTGLILCTAACDDDPIPPVESLRFGQVGEVRVTIVTPLSQGLGETQQILTWNSQGPWVIHEEISYRGTPGDDGRLSSGPSSSRYAASYAALILQVNDNEALNLFIPSLDPELDPDCGVEQSRVTFRIWDDLRKEEISWTRCGSGPLEDLEPAGAGPDADAARVIVAAMLARDLSLPSSWNSDFHGSLPFATLDRGEGSGVEDLRSAAFVGTVSEAGDTLPPPQWLSLWREHAGSEAPPPDVDWAREMVLVAGDGPRYEAGDSIEIRLLLPGVSGPDPLSLRGDPSDSRTRPLR
jgi:hypothetical protein